MGLAPDLEPLLAVAAATLDESGRLIEANAGFLRLVGPGGFQSDALVARFFIQPDFAALVATPAGANGEIHSGLLTMADHRGRTRSLLARVWRVGARLRVLAEYDVAELERLYETVLELNADYANAQLEVVRTNLKLQQREARLEQMLAQLTAAHSELKRAQDQLLQSAKLASIGQLAAGMAHEINNPIGFVNGNVGALKCYVDDLLAVISAYDAAEAASGPLAKLFAPVSAMKARVDLPHLKEDVVSLFSESREGLDRVKRIVQALRDFSCADGADAWKDEDIREGIDSALAIAGNEIHANCDVHKDYGELPVVACVLSQINQVFLNLLLNASQATKDRGVVTIRTGRQRDEVWVEIADTGEGIPPGNLALIFDPFFTTRPVGKGTGLGLAVAYGIVERHRGRIEVKSEVGKGSAFRVWLPIERAAGASGPDR